MGRIREWLNRFEVHTRQRPMKGRNLTVQYLHPDGWAWMLVFAFDGKPWTDRQNRHQPKWFGRDEWVQPSGVKFRVWFCGLFTWTIARNLG